MEVLYARCCGLDVHREPRGGLRERHRSWTPLQRNPYLWCNDQGITALAPMAGRSQL
jgi:hypothetical protein